MKIVVLDGYTLNPGDLSWARLEELGDLTIYDRTSYKKEEIGLIIERAREADIILTNKTPISEEVMDSLPKLKYIGVLATGYNIVDISAAKDRGILVSNVPSYGTEAVAQMTFALILEFANHVGLHSRLVKEGKWIKNPDWCFWDQPLMELKDKKMGIIGYGRIGRQVGHLARAFGMEVLALSRGRKEEAEDKETLYLGLEELLNKSDIVSLHCPLTEETEGIINKKSLSLMKKEALLINTSRGDLIVEEDLYEALVSGQIRGAALDVLKREPMERDNPLLSLDNCLITPHIAWATVESRERLLNIVVENIRSFLDGEAKNIVEQ